MKKIMIVAMLILSTVSMAELPSWGMTESQYGMPNFNSKMKEIGAQAAKNNWLLKITAPQDWHKKIRMGLTDSGSQDVQVNFKDSLYQSIAISAAKGIKVAHISSSTTTATVQKQVVIDKPEIESIVEAPEFEALNIQSNNDELLESINNLKIAVPKTSEVRTEKVERPKVVKAAPQPVVEAQVKPTTPPVVVTTPAAVTEADNLAVIQETLRKRYARSKRVDKDIKYSNITLKDELFLLDDVVLVKRFINQGAVLYYWMQESYDPSIHKLVEKGSGKFQKDPSAEVGVSSASSNEEEKSEETAVEPTQLDFVAVDTDGKDQDDLRKDYARNKGVDISIKASQLKKDDVLYVLNNTVLVERPITSTQSSYFWLVGDTTINHEVERKNDNRFIIR